MSVINWLKTKPTPRFFWSNRAAYGVANESNIPLDGSLGLLRFDSQRPTDELWEPFGQSRFVVPQEFKLETRDAVIPSPAWNNRLNYNTQDNRMSPDPLWSQTITRALNLIQQNQLQKVVLARKEVLKHPHPIHPLILFEKLRQIIPQAHHFYFEPKPGLAFLGASPEQLYRRVGQQIESEAQAGTRIRGQTPSEDKILEQELSENPKDHHEHQLVVEYISHALSTICLEYGVSNPKQVVKLPNVQHLKTRLSGILKNTITDQAILAALHPTSAVCGYPISNAFEFIRGSESFDRGFYTGAFGFITEKKSEFNVAIRCAVISGCDLHLFAGAGIVEGSTATDEWQEIENKMAFWRELI